MTELTKSVRFVTAGGREWRPAHMWHPPVVATLDEARVRESERVEWKQSDRPDDILPAVCALANDLGESGRDGYLVLGVDDDGNPVGIDTSDSALQRIGSRLASTKILPHPSCSIDVVAHAGSKVIVVTVHPAVVPPAIRVDSVVYVRVGTSTRRATDADVARLAERRPPSALPFDLRPVRGVALEDLDLQRLRYAYDGERAGDADPDAFPDLEPWLGQRDVTRLGPDGWTPTAAGLLVYGRDPQQVFPGATIELARYAGTDFDAPVVTRKTITGTLPDQLEGVWAQLKANLVETPGTEAGIRSPYAPQYPLDALKELARNLVQHRLYEGTNAPGRVSWLDDRLVLTNPGSPFGQARAGELGEHSDYRNPTITRFLVELGYVEKLGRGIRRARKQLSQNGNPALEVETDGYTTLVVRPRS